MKTHIICKHLIVWPCLERTEASIIKKHLLKHLIAWLCFERKQAIKQQLGVPKKIDCSTATPHKVQIIIATYKGT